MQTQPEPLLNRDGPGTPLTRSEAEKVALKNNPRITASHLLALAAGQITRQTRSGDLPQIYGAITAEKAEDGARIGAGSLTDSRLYTHAGAGGTFTQLITDFGHTSDLVASNKLQQKAQDRTTLATQQDVLLATDAAFYRLLNAQSLLQVAKATVAARGDVENLTSALTKSALKSDLDQNIASADLSQSQLLQLDAENAVASASATLAAVLAAPSDTIYTAVEDSSAAPPPPPAAGSSAALNADAQKQRPDLQALQLNAQAYQKYARAEQLQHLPTITALATGGITPVAPDNIFIPHWYAAGGVNLSVPLFTGFRIDAQAKEARFREKAAEEQAQDLSETIARDVRIAVLNAQTAFRRIGVADQFRNQTAQALALARTRYKLGLSSIVELSQAQLQSTQAAVAAVNARYDYLPGASLPRLRAWTTCALAKGRYPFPDASGGDVPKTEVLQPGSSESILNSAQPNVLAAAPDAALMTPRMWAMVLLTGIGAGVASGLLMRLLRLVQHLSFSYATGDFLTGVRRTSGEHRFLVVALGGVFAGLSLFLLRRITGGSGGEVTGAIWHRQGQFEAAPTIAKSIISIVIVGMGAAIGREAALKDSGATVAGKLSDWTRLSPEQRHLLVACGAGAGMAAAYNVPLGGALFAIEVLLGTMSLTNVLASVVTSFVAVAVSWFFLPNVPTFNVAQLSITPSLLLWAGIAGPILGAASAMYVRFIGWSETGKPKAFMVIAAPILVFLGLAVVSIHFPEILGNGKNVVQEAFGSQLGTGLLCWLLILRPLATAMCLKSGAPGGLFTPTMTFGALLGGLLGEGWSHLAPATAKDSYAIVGAGAMLASASQGPISSVVFMLELTNHTDALIVPLLIAVAGATLVARKLEVHSIYSIRG